MDNKNYILNIDNDIADAYDDDAFDEPCIVAECDGFADESSDMSFNDFVDAVTGLVAGKLGDEFSVSHSTVSKNNSVDFEAISILENGRNIAPSIYLERFYIDYKTGLSVEMVADEIVSMYRNCMRGIDDNILREYSFESMKDSIIYKLINYEMNREMLERTPHIRYRDLAVIFCCLVRLDCQGMGTVRITDEHMEHWGVDVEQLRVCAAANSERLLPHSFRDILNVLAEMMLKEMEESDGENFNSEAFADIIECIEKNKNSDGFAKSMYVLTTKCGINGASCLVYDGVLKSIYDRFGCGFYILPSSVNEVIVIPDISGEGREIFESMVPEVNREKVPAQDVLSDRVYHYPEDDFKLI